MDHDHEYDGSIPPNMAAPACVGRNALHYLPEQRNDFAWISLGAWTQGLSAHAENISLWLMGYCQM